MNRNSVIASLVTLIVVVAGVAYYAWIIVAPPTEILVYRALLEELGVGEAPFDTGWHTPAPVLMSQPTQCNAYGAFEPYDDKEFGGPRTFHSSLYASFLEANKAGVSPIQIGSLSDLIAVLDYDAAKAYSGKLEALKPLNRRVTALSRVGFDESKTEALLCIERNAGVLYHFRLGKNGWELVGAFGTWVS